MEAEVEQTLLEDGEIFDSDDGYTPLERPSNYAAPPLVQQQHQKLDVDSETEEEEALTSSNSDSDDQAQTKRPKLKPKPRPAKKPNSKYDIWSEKAQEDVLAETLNFCDVTQKDRSRSVESYDYTLSYSYNNARAGANNKRTRDDRKNQNKRHTKRSPSRDKEKGQQQKPRFIQALTVDSSNTPEEIATDIANKLFEENEEIVQKVVQVFGAERSIEVFAKTRRIEEEGGMLILNMSRRRTPGGVFLYLIRTHDHITKEQRDEIFDFDKQKQRAASKSRQKKKLKKMKEDIAAARAKTLPNLLTRAEVMAPRVNNNRNSDESDVGNPPNTPEAEEQPGNSSDGMDGNREAGNSQGRKLQTYENDLFGFDNAQEMDLF